jgi:D-alanyl-D-alanine dipeptidase
MLKFLVTVILVSTGLYAEMIQSNQLLVVTAQKWSSSEGTLQRYEKKQGKFVPVGGTIEVLLGRNGLGWGIGLHTTPPNATWVKKEGDGRAPAGIFELKQAFGYDPLRTLYPYKAYDPTDHCVDDRHSKYYNKIVNSKETKRDYKSFEIMEFKENYYKYGVVVNHNHIDEKGAIQGAGSCIFLHIKSVPTAGCTAMREKEMKEVIEWLRVEANPLLVQGTDEVVKMLLSQIK